VAEQPLLEIRSVSKRFTGVQALRDVSLKVNPGEVLALIGENGAGKSTLMKILAGVQGQDSGEIFVDGKPVQFDGVSASIDAGIVLIHQELNLSDNLDVGSNIYLGREPLRFGLIDKAAIQRGANDVLERVGLDVSPSTIVHRLSVGQQQMVEIAKALSVRARLLIMDEPTSSLSHHETENLFRAVKALRAKGVSVIYISHRLSEVRELADRVCVLRDGENAGELARDEIAHDTMVQMMVGRDVSQYYARKPHKTGDIVLEAKKLRTAKHPEQELSFSLRAGEIVGVAGLVGAGRTEMLQTLFGVEPPVGGSLQVAGRETTFRSPLEAIGAGMALVPEDRKQQGLILEMAVEANIGLAGLRKNSRAAGFVNWTQQRQDAIEMIDSLGIKTPSPQQITRFLSGGNQQKVVLGKWLALAPKVLLLDEPTRGVDVGAKQEIYTVMDQLAAKGMAILFVSSEMEEILGMADRALVMHEGRMMGELPHEQLNEEAVMQLATGKSHAA
jgi:ribose transport system ATP-binding protein